MFPGKIKTFRWLAAQWTLCWTAVIGLRLLPLMVPILVPHALSQSLLRIMVWDWTIIAIEGASVVEPRRVTASDQLHSLMHWLAIIPCPYDRVLNLGEEAWHLSLSSWKLGLADTWTIDCLPCLQSYFTPSGAVKNKILKAWSFVTRAHLSSWCSSQQKNTQETSRHCQVREWIWPDSN